MGQSASQAAAFYRDVARGRRLWTCRDDAGFPTSTNRSGEQAQPFWSSLSRVERIIKTVPAYRVFSPVEITWDDFVSEWVPDLRGSGLKVGVNWSGKHAIGYDLAVDDVVSNVDYHINESHSDDPVDSGD